MLPEDSTPAGAVRIPLRRRDGSVRAYAIVDAADAEFVNQWRWSLQDVDGYVRRGTFLGGVRKNHYLHRELMGCSEGDEVTVDHINRDKLDNRRSNLRAITQAGNSQNRIGWSGASSKHRGVFRQRKSGRWMAQIKVNRRSIYLGSFATEEEAAAAARAARQVNHPYATD